MAPPRKIMIVRHGEKPVAKHQKPYGISAEGDEEWESLTTRGWQRAGALASLFDPPSGAFVGPQLAKPTVIYASKPRGSNEAEDAEGSKSKRPLETVTPLAAKLALAPKLDFGKGEEEKLAKAVRSAGVVVLICWQHERIPEIAQQIVREAGVEGTIPAAWPGDRFDLVWVFDPPATAGGRWRFTQVPQNLLHGDKNTVIA
jgi:broad specificity phosphatase PhoE